MDTTNPHVRPGEAQELNHETTDVSLTGVTRIAVASLVVLAVILGVVYGMYRAFTWNASDTQTLPALSAYTPDARVPQGKALLQPDEPSALRQMRAEEAQILQHYGWVDKTQGIVRIPIAKAMELVVARPDLVGSTAAPAATPATVPTGAAAAPATAAPAPGAATTPAPPKGH